MLKFQLYAILGGSLYLLKVEDFHFTASGILLFGELPDRNLDTEKEPGCAE